ncbi:MAG TPA: vWA domain-containing protein [Thermoanaerobaculia bacterium]|nr:vWA domain-containing protein [Thermoanaerobaculia bacterium]
MLILDASGSMARHPNSDDGEVCGNGLDDDGDSFTDEADDCSDPRVRFLRAAGRSVIELANGTGVRAGIITFNETPTLRQAFLDIPANLDTLTDHVDAVTPGGDTAIGSALQLGKTTFDDDAAPNAGKAAVIITDGQNTAGPAPDVAVPDYVAAGIRIYSISTGGASSDSTLTAISNNTRGHRVDEPESRSLVTAVAEMWSLYTNGGIVVPKSPYAINRNNQGEKPIEPGTLVRPSSFPASAFVEFDVEPQTREVTALLAGNLNEMNAFGVRATLRRPDGVVVDSDAPPAGTRVVYDRDFTFIRLRDPLPGRWRLTIFARPAAGAVQTGNMIVLSDNPQTHLFADLDKFLVSNPLDRLRLTLLPSFFTGLRDVAWDVRVRRPDGAVVPVAVIPDPGKPQYYSAAIDGFPNAGMYEIDIAMRSTPATTIDPGEPRPGTNPPNAMAVPPLERHTKRFFFVTSGPDVPGGGKPKESDDFWFGFAVGSSHPLGRLDDIADANIYAKVDVERLIAPRTRARLTLGLAQFTPQPHFTHLSLNLHRLFPRPSGVDAFAEIGPGLYRDGGGTTRAGANLGAGFRFALTAASRLEFGADYHVLVTDGQTHFLTWHLGVLFR